MYFILINTKEQKFFLKHIILTAFYYNFYDFYKSMSTKKKFPSTYVMMIIMDNYTAANKNVNNISGIIILYEKIKK